MTPNEENRRAFMKIASTAVVSGCLASTARPMPQTEAKALNDNPGMIGMNYVDTNIGRECDIYGQATARSATAGRDKWFVGFASSEDRYVHGLADQLTPATLMGSIEDRLRSYKTDMLEEYPQFQVIVFPCLFLGKESVAEELLELARNKDVGTIGMKPFGAGSVFGPPSRRRGQDNPKTDGRAHVLLKEMLQDKGVSAIIPGVNIPEHLDENVKASRARDMPNSGEEGRVINDCTANFYANVTPRYTWLRTWDLV
jgi:hypothetical protein